MRTFNRARGKGISEIAGYYPRVISMICFTLYRKFGWHLLVLAIVQESYANKSTSNSYEVWGLWYTMIVHAVSGSLHGYYVCPMEDYIDVTGHQ